MNEFAPKETPHREETLRQAYEEIQRMPLGDREAEVKLALKALLVIRGSISLPETPEARNRTLRRLYPAIVKYVRASEAETLGALINDVVGALSPDWTFVSHPALGEPIRDIYQESETAQRARQLLKEETVPLVILMKQIYQRFVSPQEAAEEQKEQAELS